MKMNETVKKLWVDALRSGVYKQAEGKLRGSVDSFCCLGVLCNLHAQAHPQIAEKQKNKYRYRGAVNLPPASVLKWAGLDIGSEVKIFGVDDYLYAHNDDGRTFKQIAKAIEEQL